MSQETDRSDGLGGSDEAAAHGLSRWKSRLQLYLEKTGQWEANHEDNEYQEWGKRLEPVIRQHYADKTGFTVVQPLEKIRSITQPHLFMHPDGLVLDDEGVARVFEAKSAWRLDEAWGDDQLPDEYMLQLAHYCHITAAPCADLAVLVAGSRYRVYTYVRDMALERMMLEGAKAFWQCVIDRTPPPPDFGHRSTPALLKKMYPGTTGEIQMATEDLHEVYRRYLMCSQLARVAQRKADELKLEMLERMQECSYLVFEDGQALRRKRIDKQAYSVEATNYVDSRFVKYAAPFIAPKLIETSRR